MTLFQSWVNDGLIDMQAADDSNFLEKRSRFFEIMQVIIRCT